MSDIIQEIRSGNKEAVKSVYQQYAKDVYNFAKSITGDHDTALAATKKTFMTLFKGIQQGEEPANLRTAALKLAYDEAYKLAAPKAEEAVPEETPVEAPAAEAPAEKPQEEADVYAEPMFQRRTPKYTEPEDSCEEEYETEAPYEEEDDGFVPPQRERDQNREEVYIPKGGFDTLRINPISVEDEQEAMRSKRRSAAAEEAPRRKVKRAERVPEEEISDAEPVAEELPKRSPKTMVDEVDVYALNDDGYDTEEEFEEEKKPRSKGLFVFCIILNIILILILLWFLGGLLVNLGVLPDIDLGYSWFNAHIYPLF